jgi:creatinine amidohydrolase
MEELTPAGNIGDPTVATAEKGEALVESAVSDICLLVDELAE